MILGEQIYKIIRAELFDNAITAYSDYVPDETAYPFCMYEIVNMVDNPTWAFKQDYETLTVRFNVYGNKDNPLEALEILEEIESIFNRTKKVFIDTDDGKYLICNYKVDDSVTYLNEDTYWLAISDYEFVAQRDI